MRMKLLVLLVPAVAILAGACAASTWAGILDCVGSGLSNVATSLTSAVLAAELSTWEMLLVGFLGLAYAARPRRQKSRLEGLTESRLEGLTAFPEGRREG